MRCIMVFLLIFATAALAMAQDTFRVGDMVEYRCNCFGREWVRAKVEAVDGNTVRVRWGNVRNQVATVTIASGEVRAVGSSQNTSNANQPVVIDNSRANAAKLAADDKIRWAFRDDALNKYYRTVMIFAPFYDKK